MHSFLFSILYILTTVLLVAISKIVLKKKSTGANEEAQEEEEQPNSKNPYCGHENTIFKWIDQSTGEWHRCCEETPKPEGAKVAKDAYGYGILLLLNPMQSADK